MVDGKSYKDIYQEQYGILAESQDAQHNLRAILSDLVDKYGVEGIPERHRDKLPDDLRTLKEPNWRHVPKIVAKTAKTAKSNTKNVLLFDKYAKQFVGNEDLYSMTWEQFAKKYGFLVKPIKFKDRKTFVMVQVYVQLRKRNEDNAKTATG